MACEKIKKIKKIKIIKAKRPKKCVNRKNRYLTTSEDRSGIIHYCTKCGASLDLQPGFSPELDTWVCNKCGQFLYGDVYDGVKHPGVMWYCDSCNALLNIQPGFSDTVSDWICKECGYKNKLNRIIKFKSPFWGD